MNLDLRVGLCLHRCHQNPRPLSPNLVFLVVGKSLINYVSCLTPNESIIFVMTADPNPDEVSPIFNGECSVSKPHTDGPKLAYLLKMEGGISWVCYEQAEIPSRNPLNRFWELLKMTPKAGSCPMHLGFLECALFFGFKSFGNQEVQFSAF